MHQVLNKCWVNSLGPAHRHIGETQRQAHVKVSPRQLLPPSSSSGSKGPAGPQQGHPDERDHRQAVTPHAGCVSVQWRSQGGKWLSAGFFAYFLRGHLRVSLLFPAEKPMPGALLVFDVMSSICKIL